MLRVILMLGVSRRSRTSSKVRSYPVERILHSPSSLTYSSR